VTLIEAILRAAEVERGGARFYRMLAEVTTTYEEASELFSRLAREEVGHAEALEQRAQELEHAAAVDLPDAELRTIEATRLRESDLASLHGALATAVRAEQNAERYYNTLSKMTEGEVKGFFRGLAKVERGHAAALKEWYVRLAAEERES